MPKEISDLTSFLRLFQGLFNSFNRITETLHNSLLGGLTPEQKQNPLDKVSEQLQKLVGSKGGNSPVDQQATTVSFQDLSQILDDKVARPISDLITKLEQPTSVAPQETQQVAPAAVQPGVASPAAVTPASQGAGGAGVLATFGKIAVAGFLVVEALEKVTSATASFVEALSPATMTQLSLAFRNLEATIGTAFEGAFVELIRGANEWAKSLAGLAHELGPVFTKVSAAIVENINSLIQLLVAILEPLVPLLDALADVGKELADEFRELVAAVQLVIDVLRFLAGAAPREEHRPSAAAIRGVTVQSVENVAKQLAIASAAASGAGDRQKKDAAGWIEQMHHDGILPILNEVRSIAQKLGVPSEKPWSKQSWGERAGTFAWRGALGTAKSIWRDR